MKQFFIIFLFIIFLSNKQLLASQDLYEQTAKLITENKLQEALTPLSEHLKDNSNDDKAYNLMGIIYRSLAVSSSSNSTTKSVETEEFIKKAKEYFYKSITLNNNNNDARINLASLSYSLGHKEKAIILYNDALKVDAQNMVALENLAIIMIGENKIDEAKVFYTRLAKKEPNRKGVNMGLGIIAIKENKIKEARSFFKKEIDLDKTNLESYFNLAIAYEHNLSGIRGGVGAEPKKALEYYEQILKQDAEHVDALFNSGILYSMQKNYDKAIEYTKKALTKADDSYVAYYNLACFYALKNDKPNAIANLKKSIELGYRDFSHIESDKDLNSIRNEDGYKELVKQYKKQTNI